MDEKIKRWTAYKIILLLKHILCFLAYQRPEAIRAFLLANATIVLFIPSEIPSFLETQIIPSVRVYKRCCFR